MDGYNMEEEYGTVVRSRKGGIVICKGGAKGSNGSIRGKGNGDGKGKGKQKGKGNGKATNHDILIQQFYATQPSDSDEMEMVPETQPVPEISDDTKIHKAKGKGMHKAKGTGLTDTEIAAMLAMHPSESEEMVPENPQEVPEISDAAKSSGGTAANVAENETQMYQDDDLTLPETQDVPEISAEDIRNVEDIQTQYYEEDQETLLFGSPASPAPTAKEDNAIAAAAARVARWRQEVESFRVRPLAALASSSHEEVLHPEGWPVADDGSEHESMPELESPEKVDEHDWCLIHLISLEG